MPVPYFRPQISDAEIAEVTDSLRSGWLTTGPKVRRFEESFAAAVGGRFAVAGQWLPPTCYPRPGESARETVKRECRAARTAVAPEAPHPRPCITPSVSARGAWD